jgi:hypothetical protein
MTERQIQRIQAETATTRRKSKPDLPPTITTEEIKKRENSTRIKTRSRLLKNPAPITSPTKNKQRTTKNQNSRSL